MYENITETIFDEGNIIVLNIPEDDYFLVYEDLTKDAAKEIIDMYFQMRAREGIPHFADIGFDKSTHYVKISVEVEEDKHRDHKLEPFSIPDTLNVFRRQ